MSDILTERAGSILRVTLNRPAKKNAMTSSMYVTLAEILNDAAKNEEIRVVLWSGAGDSFSAGNDLQDFLKNPPGPGESPQAQLANALLNFDKPLIAAVQGVAIGGGTTSDTLRLRVRRCKCEVPTAFCQSWSRAGVWIQLVIAGAQRIPPGC